VKLAKMLQAAIPTLEKIRFVNSGTEAVMTTIRLARSYTGRMKMIKFAGCYHGHSDPVLVAAGSGPSTLGVPDSAGIPLSTAQEVITVPFNDPAAFSDAMDQWGNEVACVLVEPIVGNFGIVLPEPGFLEEIHRLSKAKGALVIYDEVITAFRFTYGGAQTLLGLEPDLTALGKIIGGGTPIGAYGGKRAIMDHISPLGPTYQAGTMAGNPLSLAAGIACLEVLREKGTYEHLDRLGEILETGILSLAEQYAIGLCINRFKGALTVYFGVNQVKNYEDAKKSDDHLFALFFKEMLKRGINLAPSKYEAWFITTSHTEADIKETLDAVEEAFKVLKTSHFG